MSASPPPPAASETFRVEAFEQPSRLRIVTVRFAAAANVGVEVELKAEHTRLRDDAGVWDEPRLSVYGLHRVPASGAVAAAALVHSAIGRALADYKTRFEG